MIYERENEFMFFISLINRREREHHILFFSV